MGKYSNKQKWWEPNGYVFGRNVAHRHNNKKHVPYAGAVGNSMVDGQISTKTTYRSRKSAVGSRYDKINCEHGTIATKDYLQQLGNVGRANIIMEGFKPSSTAAGDSFGLFRNTLVARGVTPPLGGVRENLIQICWQKKEYSFTNIDSIGCDLIVYDLIYKNDSNDTPFEVMQADIANFGNPTGGSNDYYISITGYSGTSEMSRDYNPWQGDKFPRMFTKVRSHKVFLPPGESYKHTTFFRMNYVYDYLLESLETAATYKRGVAHGILAFARGKVAHIAAGTPTYSGTLLDNVASYTTYARQVWPFKEHFNMDFALYPGEGAPGATVYTTNTVKEALNEQGV